jgi:hypothetical protein
MTGQAALTIPAKAMPSTVAVFFMGGPSLDYGPQIGADAGQGLCNKYDTNAIPIK